METINTIKESDILFDFFKKGKIKLRIAKNLFSTSFVAYDVFGKFLTVGKDGHVYNEIKATFYQYKCTESKDEPSIIVNSLHNRTWYDFFKNTIKLQWEDSVPIEGVEAFHNLVSKIAQKNASCPIKD